MPCCENEDCLLEQCTDFEDCRRTLGDSLRARAIEQLNERLARFKKCIRAKCIAACNDGKTKTRIFSDLVDEDKFLKHTALEFDMRISGFSGEERYVEFDWSPFVTSEL